MKIYASIHVGSYGISMKVFEIKKGYEIKLIEQKRRRIEVSRDIYETKGISTDTFFEMIQTLTEMKDTLLMYKANDYDAYVTASLMYANNLMTFIDQVRLLCDIKLSILDYSMQKYMLYKALCRDSKFINMIEKRCVLVDIGGAGVQLTLFDNGRLVTTQNAKIGATDVWEDLRLLEQKSDYIEVLSQMLYKEIETYYTMFMESELPSSLVIINNPIGQIKQSALCAGKEYLKSIKKLLKESSYSVYDDSDSDMDISRLSLPFLLLYQSVMERLPVEDVYIAPISLHEGLAYDYAMRHRLISQARDFDEDVISASWALARRYGGRVEHLKSLEKLSTELFDAIKKRHGMEKRERLLLRVAAILHDTGKYISLSDEASCTYTIIKSTQLLGVSERERNIIAWICVFRHNGVCEYNTVAGELDREDFFLAKKLYAILEVAGVLDISHKHKFKKISFRADGIDELYIIMDTQDSMTLETSLFRQKAEIFFNVFAIRPILKKKRIVGKDA